jgi:hypothetical protein
MAKFWKIIKAVIFGWGALTLSLLLFIWFVNIYQSVFNGSKHSKNRTVSETEDVVFEKKEGALKVVVKRKEADGPDAYLMSLSKGSAQIVQNYRLPTEKYHLQYVRFYDADFLPSRENEPRIVLYSSSEEGEGAGDADSQMWFLKMSDKVNICEVVSLSDVHRIESGGLEIMGSKRIGLPYQEGSRYESFVVPVMVRVGDSIRISSLLSSEGLGALHSALEHEIKTRMEKLLKNKEERHGEQYQKIRKEMNEALSEKVITY